MTILSVGDIVYFCRIVQNCDIYELIELHIRTVCDNWFVGCSTDTKQAFLFSNKNIDKNIFFNKHTALTKLKTIKKKNNNE